MTSTDYNGNSFLNPATDQQVQAIQNWCVVNYHWAPTDIQVREVWENYRGSDTNFMPSSHFDKLTSIHISGLVLAIEKADVL